MEHSSNPVTSLPPASLAERVLALQQQLAATERLFEPLRKRRRSEGGAEWDAEWDAVSASARSLRTQLYELTGDCYGKPKAKRSRPGDDAASAADE